MQSITVRATSADLAGGEFLAQFVQRSRSSSAMVMMYVFAPPIPGSCLFSALGLRSPINEAKRVGRATSGL